MSVTSAIAAGDALALARALVREDTRNPALAADGPGEWGAARVLAEVLGGWGFTVETHEAAPGRPNVVARIGTPGGRSLMFNGHLDVVGVEGMTHAPFDPVVSGGRLHGRGAADMKGGVAAMCAAAARVAAAGALDGELVIAAVADEEWMSIGTRALVARGVRADAAIVTEPTSLAIMPAHRGFVWTEVTVHGVAAHGSRYELGVDAIRHAGLLLYELDLVDAELLPARTHPLLGRASLHAALVEGGIGMSTYPDRCVLKLERRTLPGDDTVAVLRELDDACARVRARRADFNADVRLLFDAAPSDVAIDAPVVRALGDALTACGEGVRIEGMSAWTDCAVLNAAGIPAICFGPGDIAQAHAAEEWIETDEIERATAVLERLARTWLSGEGAWRN